MDMSRQLAPSRMSALRAKRTYVTAPAADLTIDTKTQEIQTLNPRARRR